MTVKLIIMCGLPCSGKTTRAKQLEKSVSALRLTPDEWMEKIVGDGFDEKKRAAVEETMISIASRCLNLGINVILDFGFWSKEERNQMRKLASTFGAAFELCYLNVPIAELLRRMQDRQNQAHENTFVCSEEQMRLWASWFQRPDEEELLCALT